jgi:hypothetical protein
MFILKALRSERVVRPLLVIEERARDLRVNVKLNKKHDRPTHGLEFRSSYSVQNRDG